MYLNALVFASLPPPVGGIASIVAILHKGLGHRTDIGFESPIAKQNGFIQSFTRPLLNFLKLVKAVNAVKKNGKILFFSSSQASFYEKVLWSTYVALRGRTPVIVMVDGKFPTFWEARPAVLRHFFTYIVSRLHFEIGAQSETWQKYYFTLFPSASIKVVGATADEEFCAHQREGVFPLREVTLLYVGWIIQAKGITDMLDAMVILAKPHPEIRLRLVGPLFGQDDYWNKAIADRQISEQVKLIGPLFDRNMLIREYDSASIFVFPSHFEGFPVALLEAITIGMACVGTTAGGIPDILDHGQAGILVAPASPLELAAALKSLLDDPERVEFLTRQALHRAKTVYSHAECLESYKRLMGLN